jgi:hypothetical protein
MTNPDLHVATLDELRRVEPDAVARLNEQPSLALLFLTAPVEALGLAGVQLSPEAVEEWRALVGTLPSLPAETAALRELAPPDPQLTVRIQGLLPPPGVPPEQEDE